MVHHAAVTTVLSSSWRDPIDRNGSAQLWLAAIISACDQQVPALTPIAISSHQSIQLKLSGRVSMFVGFKSRQ